MNSAGEPFQHGNQLLSVSCWQKLLAAEMQEKKRKEKKRKEKKRKEKKRKDYAFWRQYIEKPSIIPGCPVIKRY